MELLKDMPHTAGLRTTLRAIESGKAAKVFIAQDADVFVRRRAQEAPNSQSVPYEYVPTMKELGDCCGLAIQTACAALLKA